MSVSSMLQEVASSFNSLKLDADRSVSELKTKANWGDAFALWNPQPQEMLYHQNNAVPIPLSTATDAMLKTVQDLATKIDKVKYIAPKGLDPNFKMLDTKQWKSSFLESIQSNLSSYISSMGIPNSTYQNAIFNEDYDRKRQTLADLMGLADSKVGAKGFTYTNSQATVIKLDAQQKYQFDKSQVGRDISKLVTEWARQNYQFAIEKGLTLEQFHADFTYKYCTAFVDIYKNLVLAAVDTFKAEIAAIVEPINGLVMASKFPLEKDKLNADIQKANTELAIQDNQVQINEVVDRFKAATSSAIATYQAQLNASADIMKQVSSYIQAASRTVIGIDKST